MSIAVECPKCEASLSAPDTAAGKKIRCPECQAVVPVPAEAEEESPRPRKRKKPAASEDEKKPRKRKKPRPEEVDENEGPEGDLDDDEERSPRVYQGKIPPQVWIAYGICLAIMIGGLVGGVFIVNGARDREAAAKAERQKPVQAPVNRPPEDDATPP